jgi:hypothetical protein
MEEVHEWWWCTVRPLRAAGRRVRREGRAGWEALLLRRLLDRAAVRLFLQAAGGGVGGVRAQVTVWDVHVTAVVEQRYAVRAQTQEEAERAAVGLFLRGRHALRPTAVAVAEDAEGESYYAEHPEDLSLPP